MGVGERKEWGNTDEAGPATMTSRALKMGKTKMGWQWSGGVGCKAGPATMTSPALKVGVTGVGYKEGMEVDGCKAGPATMTSRRSKGLCVVLLPFTDKFLSCALHSLRTMCGYRQGIFTVGAASLDHQALGDFISQPDTSLEGLPSTFDDHSWKVAHQITYFGSWNASLSLSGSLPKHVNFTRKALFSLPPNNASSMMPLILKTGSQPSALTPSRVFPFFCSMLLG